MMLLIKENQWYKCWVVMTEKCHDAVNKGDQWYKCWVVMTEKCHDAVNKGEPMV